MKDAAVGRIVTGQDVAINVPTTSAATPARQRCFSRVLRVFLLLAGGLLLTVAARASLQGKYEIIVERNVFGLHPIPPPEPLKPPEVPKGPTNEVQLTGISTLSGNPSVFLQVVDGQTKKTEILPILHAGESHEKLKVLSIDAVNGVAVVEHDGVQLSLDFVHNGVKPAGNAVPVNAHLPPPRVMSAPPAPPPTSGTVYSGPAPVSLVPAPHPALTPADREALINKLRAEGRLPATYTFR